MRINEWLQNTRREILARQDFMSFWRIKDDYGPIQVGGYNWYINMTYKSEWGHTAQYSSKESSQGGRASLQGPQVHGVHPLWTSQSRRELHTRQLLAEELHVQWVLNQSLLSDLHTYEECLKKMSITWSWEKHFPKEQNCSDRQWFPEKKLPACLS